MLLNLHVKNFALIDEADLDFREGLNVLTGETGAGKSILIDSVNAALGGRVRSDVIRKGADFAYIELVFSVDGEEKKEALRRMGISGGGTGDYFQEDHRIPQRLPHQWRGMQYLAGKSSCVPAARHPRPA